MHFQFNLYLFYLFLQITTSLKVLVINSLLLKLWRLEDGRLANKTGMVADIADSNREEGAQIVAWEEDGGLNQKWYLKDDCIHSVMTDMVMDVKEGVLESGTEVIMFSKHGGANQKWFIYPAYVEEEEDGEEEEVKDEEEENQHK